MNKRPLAEVGILVVALCAVVLVMGGIETMPRYMLDYLSKANLVYQGF